MNRAMSRASNACCNAALAAIGYSGVCVLVF
jgi:hypothetical protein